MHTGLDRVTELQIMLNNAATKRERRAIGQELRHVEQSRRLPELFAQIARERRARQPLEVQS
jgi:hypothetical protein